jgi:hypothetical protein
MQLDNLKVILLTETRSAASACLSSDPEAPVENVLMAAFNTAKGHWLVMDDDTRFWGGTAGAYAALDAVGRGEDATRVRLSLKLLNALCGNDCFLKVPEVMEEIEAAGVEPQPLYPLWERVNNRIALPNEGAE